MFFLVFLCSRIKIILFRDLTPIKACLRTELPSMFLYHMHCSYLGAVHPGDLKDSQQALLIQNCLLRPKTGIRVNAGIMKLWELGKRRQFSKWEGWSEGGPPMGGPPFRICIETTAIYWGDQGDGLFGGGVTKLFQELPNPRRTFEDKCSMDSVTPSAFDSGKVK